MRIPNKVSAVVFDMDGTLHDTETLYYEALKLAVQAVGFTVTDTFCLSLIGIPGHEADTMLCEHLGPTFPFAEYDRHYHGRIRRALDTAVPQKAGALDLLESLGRRNMKAAVATSATRRAAELHLDLSGLRRHLPIIVTRDDVARGKPYPDLFLRAAELLGVSPLECLAIEDSLNGIRAAHAAGMMPVMVPDLLSPTEEIRAMCVHIAVDLYEVGSLLTEQ